jgi:hypothetical protein
VIAHPYQDMTCMTCQLSLVAFYGQKASHPFWDRLVEVQMLAKQIAGDKWQPYPLGNIHATLIGLEGLKMGHRTIGKNILELRRTHIEMDLEKVIRNTMTTPLLPISIRTGGYADIERDEFSSRGLTPFKRTLAIHHELLVAIGWPYRNQGYVNTLADLRNQMEAFGCLHKYHANPEVPDNDFYMVLGRFAEPLDKVAEGLLLSKLHTTTASWKALHVDLSHHHIRLIQYHDTRFMSARSYTLPEALEHLSELRDSYPGFAID